MQASKHWKCRVSETWRYCPKPIQKPLKEGCDRIQSWSKKVSGPRVLCLFLSAPSREIFANPPVNKRLSDSQPFAVK